MGHLTTPEEWWNFMGFEDLMGDQRDFNGISWDLVHIFIISWGVQVRGEKRQGIQLEARDYWPLALWNEITSVEDMRK